MPTTANPFDRNPFDPNAFDRMAILDGIRRWVAIQTPTEAPAQVNRLADLVADGYRDLPAPSYEKGNAGAALYEHARTLAAEIGFDLVDTSTGGGSDRNFTAPHTATLVGLGVDGKGAHTHYEQLYIASIEPRARLSHRLYQTLR